MLSATHIPHNRTQTTGSALDLLHGSAATIENCLFVGNVANMGVDVVGLLTGGEFHPENGSGAITVFAGSRAMVSRSTLTGNWSGVDDAGTGSTYVDTIFWKNTRPGGISPGKRYELDIDRQLPACEGHSSTASSTICGHRQKGRQHLDHA